MKEETEEKTIYRWAINHWETESPTEIISADFEDAVREYMEGFDIGEGRAYPDPEGGPESYLLADLESTTWVHLEIDLLAPNITEEEYERYKSLPAYTREDPRVDEGYGVTVIVHPEPPPGCEHEWREEREDFSGAGVKTTYICEHCGSRKIEDTWARDGAIEGLNSIRYEPGPDDWGEDEEEDWDEDEDEDEEADHG